jgi:hypothetical protein
MANSTPITSYVAFARTSDAYVLSVLCKRSYRWDKEGRVRPATEPCALSLDEVHARRDDRNGALVVQGRDVWPLKAATDVIVTGHAHAPDGRPVSKLDVSVSVGRRERRIVAFGPRFVEYRGRTTPAFSAPERFSSVEVSYWNAYGGIDPMVLPRGLDDTPSFAGKPTLELFPGSYPRNPSGCGYLIEPTRELLDGLELPQLEDPAHLLTPDTLLVREPAKWWRQPLPAAFGFCHALMFPRVVHCGGRPYHMPEQSDELAQMPELELGALSLEALIDKEARHPNLRMTQEAAPHMIMPFLNGDEPVKLSGFSAHGAHEFLVPSDRPNMQLRVDGSDVEQTGACIHSLVIDADNQTFYLVHSGRFVAPQDLAADISDGAPIEAVVARCEAKVDGQVLSREQWPAPADATSL